MVATADAATAVRLVSGSTVHVLVSGSASSIDGPSTLDLDHLEVQLDW
ncbi:MAG TPA: hypothetical protein VGK67_03405 [Myxococcales bacterium]